MDLNDEDTRHLNYMLDRYAENTYGCYIWRELYPVACFMRQYDGEHKPFFQAVSGWLLSYATDAITSNISPYPSLPLVVARYYKENHANL